MRQNPRVRQCHLNGSQPGSVPRRDSLHIHIRRGPGRQVRAGATVVARRAALWHSSSRQRCSFWHRCTRNPCSHSGL